MPPENPLDPTTPPTTGNFTRQSLAERIQKSKEAYADAEAKIEEAAEQVLQTEAGLIVFKYLFHLAGGDGDLMRQTPEQTNIMVARRDYYNAIRNKISSDNLSKIERHFWE